MTLNRDALEYETDLIRVNYYIIVMSSVTSNLIEILGLGGSGTVCIRN